MAQHERNTRGTASLEKSFTIKLTEDTLEMLGAYCVIDHRRRAPGAVKLVMDGLISHGLLDEMGKKTKKGADLAKKYSSEIKNIVEI